MIATTQTYMLYHTAENPTPFYVGESIVPAIRFKSHVRSFAAGEKKEAYDHLRKIGITEFYMEVVPDKTEAALVEELTLAGYKLFNANKGRKSATKSNNFKRMNDEILQRMELADKVTYEPNVPFDRQRLAEKAASRRNILLDCSEPFTSNSLRKSAQNYSKSEIVGQRIRKDVPSVEEFIEASRINCPAEMMGLKVAKTAERAECAKLGDYSLFFAYRKKDKERQILIRRNIDGSECGTGFTWQKLDEAKMIEWVHRRIHDELVGWSRPRGTFWVAG